MQSANEPIYCAEQIRIPPEFPDVLKNYSKAVLRDQPKDIYSYSVDYFQGMLKSRPSVKRLTESQLDQLFQKFYNLADKDFSKSIPRADVLNLYELTGVSFAHQEEVFKMGDFKSDVPWLNSWALSLALSNNDLASSVDCASRIVLKTLTSVDPINSVFQYLALRDPLWDLDRIQRAIGLVKQLTDSKEKVDYAKIIQTCQ